MKIMILSLFALIASTQTFAFELPKADCEIRFTNHYAIDINFAQAIWVDDQHFTTPFAEDISLAGGNTCTNFDFKTQSGTCTQVQPMGAPVLFHINRRGVIRIVKNLPDGVDDADTGSWFERALDNTVSTLYIALEEGRTTIKLESDGPHARRDFKSRVMECHQF